MAGKIGWIPYEAARRTLTPVNIPLSLSPLCLAACAGDREQKGPDRLWDHGAGRVKPLVHARQPVGDEPCEMKIDPRRAETHALEKGS
jgi:hypothetical protein